MRGMPPHVEFFVILFSNDHLEPPEQKGWTRAESANVETILSWVERRRPGGGTYPASAFKRVFSLPAPPDVIYFLTDGELQGFTPAMCAELRGDASTVVNTFARECGARPATLEEAAAATGGSYILIGSAKDASGHA
jgi:hypothetical protein